MEFIVSLLASFAFGAAAKKKGRDGMKWGAGLAAVLLLGCAAIGFYGQAARLSGGGINPASSWYWLIVACCAAAIFLYNAKSKSEGVTIGALDDTTVCPFCAETIKAKAIVCKHCKKQLPAEIRAADTPSAPVLPTGAGSGEARRTPWQTVKHYGSAAFGLLVLVAIVSQVGQRLSAKNDADKAKGVVAQTTTGNVSAPEDEYAALIGGAAKIINDWNSDPNYRLCDTIESPGVTQIQRGRIVFISMGGGKVDPPLPAIVARITGTCVIASMRSREPLTKWWIMYAYDEPFKKITCIKLGGDDLLRRYAERGCEFVPNPGQAGLIPMRGQAVQTEAGSAPRTDAAQASTLPSTGSEPAAAPSASIVGEVQRKGDEATVRLNEEREKAQSEQTTRQEEARQRADPPAAVKRDAQRSQVNVATQEARSEKSASAAWSGAWSGLFTCGPSSAASRSNPGGVSVKSDMVVVSGEARWNERSLKVIHVATGKISEAGTVTLTGSGKWVDEESRKWRTTLEGQFVGGRFSARGFLGSEDGTRKFRDCTLDMKKDQ